MIKLNIPFKDQENNELKNYFLEVARQEYNNLILHSLKEDNTTFDALPKNNQENLLDVEAHILALFESMLDNTTPYVCLANGVVNMLDMVIDAVNQAPTLFEDELN